MKIIAIDTETTGLEFWNPKVQVTTVSWWTTKGFGDAWEVSDNYPRKFIEICEDPTWTKWFWNAKFDLRMLRKAGIKIRGPVVDIMFVARMVEPDERSHSLKHFARKFNNYTYHEEIILNKWLRAQNPKLSLKALKKLVGTAPKHIRLPYAVADAKQTVEVGHILMPGCKKLGLMPTLKNEMKLMPAVMRMEERGVLVDIPLVDRMLKQVEQKISSIVKKLRAVSGNPTLNPNSNDQVRAAFYDGTVFPSRFTKKSGKPSTDKYVFLESPTTFGRLMLKYRAFSKTGRTYLRNFKKCDDENILRVHFNQDGARTGRFSSSGPNLQNIPRPDVSALGRLRKCIRARPGYRLLFNDYEQVELRLTAHFAQEPHMLEAISTGQDLHGVTATLIFGKTPEDPDWKKYRYLAKTLNFAVIYGTGPATFRDTVIDQTDGEMILSLAEAHRYIKDYKAAHPNIMKLFDDVSREVANTGGVVNHYGRFMPVDPRKPYVGVNYKIQSTAADLLKERMILIDRLLRGHKSGMVMQVHDEIVTELHHTERHLVPAIVDIMEELSEFSVPILVSSEYGQNWLEKKAVPLAA